MNQQCFHAYLFLYISQILLACLTEVVLGHDEWQKLTYSRLMARSLAARWSQLQQSGIIMNLSSVSCIAQNNLFLAWIDGCTDGWMDSQQTQSTSWIQWNRHCGLNMIMINNTDIRETYLLVVAGDVTDIAVELVSSFCASYSCCCLSGLVTALGHIVFTISYNHWTSRLWLARAALLIFVFKQRLGGFHLLQTSCLKMLSFSSILQN